MIKIAAWETPIRLSWWSKTHRRYIIVHSISDCNYQPEKMLKRLNETEKIGIVPKGVIPRYCHGLFPGEDIISFMNLPYEKEDKEKLLPYCVWRQLKIIELTQ